MVNSIILSADRQIFITEGQEYKLIKTSGIGVFSNSKKHETPNQQVCGPIVRFQYSFGVLQSSDFGAKVHQINIYFSLLNWISLHS